MAIKVFFNNSCNVCRLEINHYKKIADSNLEWIDITNNEIAEKETSKNSKQLLRRLHVKDGEKIFVFNGSEEWKASLKINQSSLVLEELIRKNSFVPDIELYFCLLNNFTYQSKVQSKYCIFAHNAPFYQNPSNICII